MLITKQGLSVPGIASPSGRRGLRLFGASVSAAAFAVAFTSITELPSWLSFSRASNAMVFDAAGKLTYAPNNLLQNSNDFTSGSWHKSGLSVTPGVADPFGGTAASTITATTTDGEIYQSISSQPLDLNWVGTIWARRRTGSGSVTLYKPDDNPTTPSLTSSWQQFSVHSPTRNAGGGIVYLDLVINASGDAIDIYAPTLSTVTYETTARSADQVVTADSAYYGPRFDHDPATLAATGLLDEEQRTNVILQSNNFSDAAWTKDFGATITSTSRPAPDGTNTACTLSANVSSGGGRIYQSISVAAVACTGSIWVRRRTGTGVINMWDPNNIVIDITSQITNTWNRIKLTNTGGSSYILLQIMDAGDEIDIADSQFEVGAFATSNIRTASAAVTRSADIVQLTGAAATAAQGASGSLLVEANALSNSLGGQVALLGSMAGNGSIHLYYFASGGNQIRTYSNVDGPLSDGTVSDLTNIHRGAVCWNVSGRSLVADGGTVGTDAIGSGLSGASSFQLGGASVLGSAVFSGHFRSLAIYNTRLSDADLQAKSVVGAAF